MFHFIWVFMFSQCSSYDPLVGEILLPLVVGIPMADGKIMMREDYLGICDHYENVSQPNKKQKSFRKVQK